MSALLRVEGVELGLVDRFLCAPYNPFDDSEGHQYCRDQLRYYYQSAEA